MTSTPRRAPYLDAAAGEDHRRTGAGKRGGSAGVRCRLLKDVGIEGTAFGTFRQSPTQLNVYSYSFLHSTQLKYFTDQKKLTVEDRRFRWDQFLTGMHARGGFDQDSVVQDSWGVVVDIVCVAILAWIASGLYMWWGLPSHRGWGWLALLSGALSFAWFVWRL